MFSTRSTWAAALVATAIVVGPQSSLHAQQPNAQQPKQQEPPLMKWSTMERITRQHVAARPAKPYPALMVWEELLPLLEEIQRKGWAMPYRRELSQSMVKQSEFLNTFAQTKAGAKYLDSVGGDLLLDRIDRISQMKGGKDALQEVVKLPNATSIQPTRSKDFMPSLKDMLPLKHGKAPEVRDYDKPTRRAYTQEQVLQVLGKLHRAEERRRAEEGIR